jgi:hypothetical protein
MRVLHLGMAAVLAMLFSGCLTTYYDTASWHDPGLAEALRDSDLDGWTLRETECTTPCVIATKGSLELVAPEPPALAPQDETPRRAGHDPAFACTLRHQGSTQWGDDDLRRAIRDFYAQLGRPAPANVTFNHMHGD